MLLTKPRFQQYVEENVQSCFLVLRAMAMQHRQVYTYMLPVFTFSTCSALDSRGEELGYDSSLLYNTGVPV